MPTWTKEQVDAIEFDNTNIIVSAGAGSGKTAVLTERIIRKLKEGVSISNLLVLTFTKEAAKEMKNRVRKKISKESSLSSQLDLVESSYITTFDSYAFSLVKKYHFLLNVSTNVNIVMDSVINIYKRKVLEEILDKYYASDDSDFNKLMGDFFVKDDKELVDCLLSINNKLDMRYDKVSFLNSYVDNYYCDDKVNDLFKMYEKLVLDKVLEVKDIYNELSLMVEGDYASNLLDSLNGLFTSINYDGVCNNLDIDLGRLPRDADDGAKDIKTKLKKCIDSIKDLCIYKEKELKSNLCSTMPYMRVIIKILLELDDTVNKYKLDNDLYEFNDICKMSIRLLKENSDICRSIRESFNEILLDEYQDTSFLQEEFISLISKNNVYMVGDIKQSIYRFRNAEPYIFKNKYDNYKNNIGGLKIDLNKNFRSRSEVIDNINLMFSLLMDNEFGGVSYNEGHNMIFGNTSYLDNGVDNNFVVYNYVKDKMYSNSEIEAFIIADDIKNKISNGYKVFDKDTGLIRNMVYDDIVILLDRSRDFDIYSKIFLYNKIPLTIIKDDDIRKGDDIFVIKNIVNLIIKVKENNYDNSFKYSFMSVGRSFLYSYNDLDLFDIFLDNKYEETDIFNKIKSIVDNVLYLDLSGLIKLIISTFDFYNKIVTVGDVNDLDVRLDYIMDIASNLSLMGYTYIDFYNYIDLVFDGNYDLRYSVNKEISGSVKIMTIHKSKGLEFPLCYYAGLTNGFNKRDIKAKFGYDPNYNFLIPFFKDGIGNTFVYELFKSNYNKEDISEKIRLFYVALTRAREKIIFVTSLPDKIKDKNSFSSFNDMILYVRNDIEKYIVDKDISLLNMTKKYFNISDNNVLDKIIVGKKIEIIPNTRDLTISKMERFSKSVNLISEEDVSCMKFGKFLHEKMEVNDLSEVSGLINNSIMKNYSNAKIYREFEFIYSLDGVVKNGVIDLMLEYDDHIDIIDYKLKNVMDDAYEKQLNGYKKYISNRTGKMVNTYLYSIKNEELILI